MLFLTAALSVVLVNLDLITFGLALALIFLPIIIAWPRIYFVFFMVARPMMDLATKLTFAGGINIASVASIVFIIVCGTLVVQKKNLAVLRKNSFMRSFNILFLLFLLACASSCFNTQIFVISMTDVLRVLSIWVAVNYAVIYFGDSQGSKKLFMLIIASSLMPLCLGLYQFVFRKGMPELGYNRLYGSFTHTNVFSQYLVLICLLLIHKIWTSRVRARNLWMYLLAAVALFELFSTYTRGAWIALAVSLAVYVLFKNSLATKLKCVLGSAVLLMALFPKLQERFADINETKYYQLSSWQWRLKMWSMATEYLKEHPFIGHGLGMYEREFSMMAHNDYLRISYEIGFVGLFLYVGMLLFLLFYAMKKMLKNTSLEIASGYKIIVSLVLGLLAMSMVDNLARSTVVVMYFFVFIGVAAAKNENTFSK